MVFGGSTDDAKAHHCDVVALAAGRAKNCQFKTDQLPTIIPHGVCVELAVRASQMARLGKDFQLACPLTPLAKHLINWHFP